ncbi:MAG TPA: hypothetical protein VFF16_14745 [Telluria sp.]|nr:hypothetical protein [Telluria sp.]
MRKTVIALMLAAASQLAPAHGVATPSHGGMIRTDGETWVELVIHGNAVEVYVQDDGDDMPTADMTGKIALVKDGAKSEFPLKPAGGNKFEGKAAGLAAGTRVLTVLTLADKKTTVSAAFDLK